MSTIRRRSKRGALGIVVAVIVLGGLALGVRAALTPTRVPGVVSIATQAGYQDRALLREAFSLPVARTYSRLVSQPNGSVCGPTSVANVQRSLGARDATPTSVLDGSGLCPLGFCFAGLTLDELATLLRAKTGKRVRIERDASLAAFRSTLLEANDPARRVIANFDRGPLFGVRGGHHSPIGGYLVERDLVLVLDVNATYRPWLVSSERLYRAVRTVDGATGRERGLLVLE